MAKAKFERQRKQDMAEAIRTDKSFKRQFGPIFQHWTPRDWYDLTRNNHRQDAQP